jgi:predicted negative regulator of RcsB-dependent stress response
MFSHIRLITVLACVGIGIAPQVAWAGSPNAGRDLLSVIRSYQSPSVKNEEQTDGASALSHLHRAKGYAGQNDVQRANACFGLALQNAAPKQVASIASDYAAFLCETGDLHKAELILRQALSQSPQNEELTRALARCLVRQEKVAEGLRYFKSIGSEAEARAEVAAIYREQGNTDMLVAVERKWGSTETAKPAFVAAVTFPVSFLSKSEMFETKVPIPVPKAASESRRTVNTLKPVSQPIVASASQQDSVPQLPAPLPKVSLPATERLTAANTAKLPMTSPPVLHEETNLPKPIVTPHQRKHYVVNANASANVNTLFPVRPVTAVMSSAEDE